MMNKKELIKKLNALVENEDTEKAHIEADAMLLKFIDDAEIEKAWRLIEKWFA